MLNRTLAVALAATALALVMAPAVGAQQPYREPVELDTQVLPACSFDVEIVPDGREWMTFYDSGRMTVHLNSDPTLTNLADPDSSQTYRLRYLSQETIDAETGEIVGRLSGRFLFWIFPGDVGPSGEIDEDGGFVHVVGRLRYVMDPETFAITSLKVRGTLTDVCAALTPEEEAS